MDKTKVESKTTILEEKKASKATQKKEWKKPTLEDVSGRVMAQPYIRFT